MNILLETVPQLIFLAFLFFYMVFMMFHKWIHYSAKIEGRYGSPCAPSILILFINMMLFNKHSDTEDPCKEYMFEGQETLQLVLSNTALACIPILLVAKPLYILYTRKTSAHEIIPANENDHENKPMSEVFILQAIHTIEYILSTISHTASYLRLWALSLAHAQLSEILWAKLFNMGLASAGYTGSIMIFIFFAVWAFFTFFILVMMEGLSAFLHTLRLHWVEFMTKFYKGEGYLFDPFCFKTIMEREDIEE